MFANGQTLISYMEQLAPSHLAYSDDKIGLQIGTLHKEIKKVLIALDVTPAVVEEALFNQVDLIIAHHAVIFRPLAHLRTDDPSVKLYETCLKNDISIYISHTNLDITKGGVNDILAHKLSLQDVKPLEITYAERLFKLIVYVPQDQANPVREAMFKAGAGVIGNESNYSHCSFNMHGEGTFLPLDGANPHIGEIGTIESVAEMRIEVVVKERNRQQVIAAMENAHPYEEVAYDLIPLLNEGEKWGIGRMGTLPTAVTLEKLCLLAKTAFDVPFVRAIGDLQKSVKHIAVLGGSGARFVHKAKKANVDVLITGDIDHHTAHDALVAGICVIDAGHHIESLLKPVIADQLSNLLLADGYKTQVIASKLSTDPFQFV